ncbi:class I adenylate-forming enzyme family protein [Streptosporangium sp. NPDC004631]
MIEPSIFAAVAESAGRGGTPALSAGDRTWSTAELLGGAEVLAARLGRLTLGVTLAAELTHPVAAALVTLATDLAGVRLVHRDPGAPAITTDASGPLVHDGTRSLPAPVETQLPDVCGLPALWFRPGCGDRQPITEDIPAGAQIFLTSGSTGEPTGVVRSARAVLEDARRVADFLGYGPGAPVVCTAPLFHAYGFNYGLIAPLLSGAPVRVLPSRSLPSRWAAAVHTAGAVILIGLPVHYGLLTTDPMAGESAPGLAGLRAGVSAGAPLTPATLARVSEVLPFPLYNCYGSSEAGAVTLTPVTVRESSGFIGAPLPGVDARVDDGELLLRTSSLALGRTGPYGSGSLTPLTDAEGWYHTGDLAEPCGMPGDVADTGLRLCGRTGSVINVAGEKVTPAQVEQLIAGHAGVVEVQVRAEPDATRGQVPVARVVLRPGVGTDELAGWCRERMAPHQVPRRFEVVAGIQHSASGKPLAWSTVTEEP